MLIYSPYTTPEYVMTILAYGLNHRTAAIDLRGQVAFGSEDQERALLSMQASLPELSEVVILSTCNRTEIHCVIDNSEYKSVEDWLIHDRNVQSRTELHDAAYLLTDEDAAEHVMRVAAGLDSQILGESQILGQFKKAYTFAREVGTIGDELSLLGDTAIHTAKRIRTETEIGKHSVSIASASVMTAQQIIGDLQYKKSLLVGAGNNIRLVVEYLISNGAKKLVIANRTLKRAAELAKKYDAEFMPLTDIPKRLHEFDLVISSTASANTVIDTNSFQAAVNVRNRQPMFIADLAVPRDIDRDVAKLPGVYLYTVDNLIGAVEKNIATRAAAANNAINLIAEGVEKYMTERLARKAGSLVTNFRTRAENWKQSSVEKAKQRLHRGEDPEKVIERLAHELTNQLAHHPTIAIRNASINKNEELLNLMRSIYEVESSCSRKI